MGKTQEARRGEDQARAQLDSIIEMVEKLDTGTDIEREEAQTIIHEDPLSVQVRSGWYSPGSENTKPEEFEILLCTGGPAARIIGELNEYLEPETAILQHQDWFTPWIDQPLTEEEEEKVLEYCRQFYFEC